MKQGWRRGLTEWRIGGGRAELTWHGTHDAAQLSRRIVTRVGVLNLRRRLLRTEEGFGVHDEGWIEVRSVSEICCELVAEFRSRGRATSTSIGGVTASIAHASCLPFPPSSLSSPRTPTSNRKDARWNPRCAGHVDCARLLASKCKYPEPLIAPSPMSDSLNLSWAALVAS